MKTKQDFLNINKKVTTGKQLSPRSMRTYFTYEDILKLQKWISNRYANFNGGFGMFSDEVHVLMSKIDDTTGFSFVVEKEKREEAARTKYRKVLFDDDYPESEWNVHTCIDKFTWLETIILICEDLGILFRYDPKIIDEIIAHE